MYFVNVTSGMWYRLLNDEQLEKIEFAEAKRNREIVEQEQKEKERNSFEANKKYEFQKAEEEALAIEAENKKKAEEKEKLIKEKQEKEKRAREIRKELKDLETDDLTPVLGPVDPE